MRSRSYDWTARSIYRGLPGPGCGTMQEMPPVRALGLVLVALTACRPGSPAPQTQPPASSDAGLREAAQTASAVDAPRAEMMHHLLRGVAAAEPTELRTHMSARLQARLGPDELRAAHQQLVAGLGQPLGILEEQVHREGPLRWYSALVLHGAPQGGGVLTPVLYQFALDADAALDHLLIREHWFIDNVEHPAEAYVPVTRFHLPANGTWYVMHGGRSRTTNYHHGNRNQRWAYDLVIKRDGRQRPRGSDRHSNDSYYAHGEDLLAPAAGTVVHVVEGVAENRPPDRGKAGGNGLIIDHGFGEFSALWHAVPGSLEVEVGDRVETGQRVARVGNSGRSTGPHIHFHVSYRPDSHTEAFGLPAELRELYVDDSWKEHDMPMRGQYIRNATGPDRPRRLTARPTVFIDRG